jgi:hypothetical protein
MHEGKRRGGRGWLEGLESNIVRTNPRRRMFG